VQIALTATPLPPAVSDSSAQVAATQAALMQNDVVLRDGADTWTIPATTVHTWLGFTIINNRVRIAIDTQEVLAQLKPLAKKIDRPAVNATVKLQGTKIVFGTPSTDGRTLNPSKTTTAVVNALRNRALGSLAVDAPIPPVLALVKASLTTDEAKAAIPLMKQISSWTTNYQPSDHNGFGANIRIPTSTINGHVVAPGETFSFWKAVGPVTKELGYQAGGAIIDGHTEPQGAIGGGICSCSTTLFNAALRAGFAMGDRLNHYYYIDRYPLGLDATVFISASGQAQDMTWTNDTEYPVVIQGINGKAFVKFVLYSVPNGRVTTFTDPIVKNYTKAHTETKVDRTIPRGTSKHIEYATDGQDVTVSRLVKDKSGAVLHKDTYYSHYSTITGIILTNP
jgi:vancomycin resistance protein YoaR